MSEVRYAVEIDVPVPGTRRTERRRLSRPFAGREDAEAEAAKVAAAFSGRVYVVAREDVALLPGNGPHQAHTARGAEDAIAEAYRQTDEEIAARQKRDHDANVHPGFAVFHYDPGPEINQEERPAPRLPGDVTAVKGGKTSEAPKAVLDGTFADQPDTPEGKFLVVRRDNTVPRWPWFVLGARDPAAAWALWFYSWVAWVMGMSAGYCRSCNRHSWGWREYRLANGNGDPDAGRHRVDDPAVIARMREGRGL